LWYQVRAYRTRSYQVRIPPHPANIPPRTRSSTINHQPLRTLNTLDHKTRKRRALCKAVSATFIVFQCLALPCPKANSNFTWSNFKFLDNSTLPPLNSFTISNLQICPQIQTLPKNFKLGKIWSSLDCAAGASTAQQNSIPGNVWSSEVIFGNLDHRKTRSLSTFSCPVHRTGLCSIRFIARRAPVRHALGSN
jgi:hypothetical protein